MEGDDPFASIVEFCQISSSQQKKLNRCRFAGEPEDGSLSSDESGGISVESTGIVMLSIPNSSDEMENEAGESRDNDVFHTPPEESSLPISEEQPQKNVAVDVRDDRMVEGVADNGNSEGVYCNYMDDSRAFDLGTDADLEFSAEVEVTERIEMDSGSQSSYGTNLLNDNQVIHFESINFRFIETDPNEREGLGETPAKKLKIKGDNSGLSTPKFCLGSEVAQTIERVALSVEKLNSPSNVSKKLDENVDLERSRKLSFQDANPQNCFNSLQNQNNKNANCVDKESQGDRSVKRELQFHSAILESGMEVNEAALADDEDIVEGYQTEEIEEESDMEDNEAVSTFREEAETETEEIEDDKTDKLCSTDETSPTVKSQEKQKNKATKCIDEIGKFRYIRPTGANSTGKDKDIGVKNVLPVSLVNNNNAPMVANVGVLSTSSVKEMTVFDVLRELAKGYRIDPSLAKLSVLEAAKRGGMTFP